MRGEERRNKIIDILRVNKDGISGTELSKKLGVSRQVIVQDIALIRANGIEIFSTNKGYVIGLDSSCIRIFKVRHSKEQIQDELEAIVDLGGEIKDVFVYHKSYGIVKAGLNIKCRKDISNYVNNLATGVSTPLMGVTSDYHYHTVVADTKEELDIIQDELCSRGYLAKLTDFEPVDFWSNQG